jgi:hypothetical protein
VSNDRDSAVRALATLGLAVSGPVALLSGLVTLATIPRGVPAVIALIFAVSAAATVVFMLVYVAGDARRG